MLFERQVVSMADRKSVILFLVEGFSDKSALENIVQVLVPKEKIIFVVMNGDITSNRSTKADNVLRRVGVLRQKSVFPAIRF